MRNYIDTARSGSGAFVARRINPEAAENIGIRRFRGRINAVAAAKGLWSRIFKNEKRSNEAGPSVSSIARSINSGLGVRTQMMNPISAPAREVNAVAEDWDVGLLPGSYPSDETLQGLAVSSFDVSSAEDATMVPLPLQFVEEIRQLEAGSSSPIVAKSSFSLETNPCPETISSPDTTAVATIQRSLSLFPPNRTTRALSPDWISAPNGARRSVETPATGSRSGSEVTFQPHSEIDLLVNNIERFKFTTLVNSTIIDNVKDTRAMINMTSSNLLNIGWDMKRLLVIWSRITLNATDVNVLRVLQPWTRVPRQHVAKACGLMQKGLQTYRDWDVISDHALTMAEKNSTISDEWWAMHYKKFQELDVVNNLDFDDAFAQVELVMEKYLGFGKEVAVMRKPARPHAVSINRVAASSSGSQRPIPASPTKDWPTTLAQANSAGSSLSAPGPATRHPKIQQPLAPSPSSSSLSSPKSSVKEGETPRYPKIRPTSSPVPSVVGPSSLKFPIKDGSRYPKIQHVSETRLMAPGPSSPKSPVEDVKRLAQAAANVPNYLRPTKASSRTSEPTGSVPGYMRPTKATRGAYTPPVKPTAKPTPAPRSNRLEFAIRGEQAKRVPAETSARPVDIKAPSPLFARTPPVPPKSTKRMTPNDLPKLVMVDRSDSVHKPHVFRGTAPRGPSPLWNSSPPIYTSTRVPLKVGGSDPPRFLRPISRGDAHGVNEEPKADEEPPPPVEPKADVSVKVARVQEPETRETEKRFDDIRAKMFEMKIKLEAINAKRTDTVSEAEVDAPNEQGCDEGSSVALVEQAEVRDHRIEATKDDGDEPSMSIIGQWKAEYDDDTEDDGDNEDEDVWYDASEVSVKDECP